MLIGEMAVDLGDHFEEECPMSCATVATSTPLRIAWVPKAWRNRYAHTSLGRRFLSLRWLMRHRIALTVHGLPCWFTNTYSDRDFLRKIAIQPLHSLGDTTRGFPTL